MRDALEVDAAIEILREPTRDFGVTAPKPFEQTVVLEETDDATRADTWDPEPTREHETIEHIAVSGDAPTRRIERPAPIEATSKWRHAWMGAVGLLLAGLLIAGANLLWIGPDSNAPPSGKRAAPEARDSSADVPSVAEDAFGGATAVDDPFEESPSSDAAPATARPRPPAPDSHAPHAPTQSTKSDITDKEAQGWVIKRR
jgi:hypothetical protein